MFPSKNLVQRIISMFIVTLVLYTGYQLSNRFHVLEPRYLALTAFDNSVPFLLWTVWPYFLLVLLAFLPVGIKDDVLFGRTMWAFVIGVCCNIVIWILFPTIYYRPALPEGEGITTYAYCWLCSIDTPANCLPSGHITSPLIGCWALSKESAKYKTWIWLSFALFSITIFTTKQHYIWDLPAGVITASIGIIWSKKFIPKQNEL